MPLTLFIKDLVISGKHGVHDHEKETPQRFGVTVELLLADDKPAHSDNLADTVDWSALKKAIVAIVTGETYDLIERLAQEIASKTLEDKRVARVVVIIDKLDAFKSGVPGVRLEVGQSTS